MNFDIESSAVYLDMNPKLYRVQYEIKEIRKQLGHKPTMTINMKAKHNMTGLYSLKLPSKLNNANYSKIS